MIKSCLVALALVVTSLSAQAEPVAVPIKPIQAVQTAAVNTPVKAAPLSQQDKMRDCSKQATGKKGTERKTFMKTCLSRKA